jgi:hypothetical protein
LEFFAFNFVFDLAVAFVEALGQSSLRLQSKRRARPYNA